MELRALAILISLAACTKATIITDNTGDSRVSALDDACLQECANPGCEDLLLDCALLV